MMAKKQVWRLCLALMLISSFMFVAAADVGIDLGFNSAEEDNNLITEDNGPNFPQDGSDSGTDTYDPIRVEIVQPIDDFSVQGDPANVEFQFTLVTELDVQCSLIVGAEETPFQGALSKDASSVNAISDSFAPGSYTAIVRCTELPATTGPVMRTGEDSVDFTVTSPPTGNTGGTDNDDDGTSPGTPANRANAGNDVQPLANENGAENSETEESEQQNFFSRLTGAFIGPNGLTGLGGIILLAVIIAIVGLTLYLRKK